MLPILCLPLTDRFGVGLRRTGVDLAEELKVLLVGHSLLLHIAIALSSRVTTLTQAAFDILKVCWTFLFASYQTMDLNQHAEH
jgi:hypothetical protein